MLFFSKAIEKARISSEGMLPCLIQDPDVSRLDCISFPFLTWMCVVNATECILASLCTIKCTLHLGNGLMSVRVSLTSNSRDMNSWYTSVSLDISSVQFCATVHKFENKIRKEDLKIVTCPIRSKI